MSRNAARTNPMKKVLAFVLLLSPSALLAMPSDFGSGGGVLATDNLTVNGLTVTTTATFKSACIQLGTPDSSSRLQIWNKCTSAILRLGASTADGDSSNVSSEGIVIYDTTNDQAARIKAARFGLTLNSDQANGYYFKVDPTLMFYSSGPLTIGGTTAPNAGQIEARTGTGVLAAITAVSGSQFARLFSTDASQPGLAWLAGVRFRIGTGTLNGGSFTELVSISSAGFVGINTTVPQALLHVKTGASGVTPHVNADEFFIENSGNAGLTIGTPNTAAGQIFFGDPEDPTVGQIIYDHTANKMTLATNATVGLYIDSNRQVGIGASAPSVQLDVESGQLGFPTLGTAIRGTVSPGREGAAIYGTSVHYVCVSTGTTSTTWVQMHSPTTACGQ